MAWPSKQHELVKPNLQILHHLQSEATQRQTLLKEKQTVDNAKENEIPTSDDDDNANAAQNTNFGNEVENDIYEITDNENYEDAYEEEEEGAEEDEEQDEYEPEIMLVGI